tara:strand:- start:269 stop:601 length:333 start_codon:yes stop_codon:yes gene_type:complete
MDLSTAFANRATNVASTLSTAVQGAKAAETKFHGAAVDVVNSYAQAANSITAAGNNDVELESSTFLASQADKGILSSLVDMKFAETAFKANLKVVSVAQEMEESTLNIIA